LSAAQRSYRHEALLYRGMDDFLAGVVPFVRDGVALGEPVMVAVTEPRLSRLRASLADVADEVLFVDMAQMGRNPAVIIPAWLDFVASHSADGSTPVRGVGEPVWPGRTATEIAECQLHEGLLNMAVAPDTPLWLLCPYDGGRLPPSVVGEAHRSHPVLLEADDYRGSTEYGGAFHIQELFQRFLPEPAGFSHAAPFSSADVGHVEHWVKHAAQKAGVPLPRAAALADAVQKLAADSVRFGGGHGVLRYWASDTTLICDVSDHEVMTDPLVGRTPALAADTHRPGLWSANRTCDLTQTRSNNAGTRVRIHTHIDAPACSSITSVSEPV
jgi:hypothetical protein